MEKKYYYLLMAQKDFFENQIIEEILRERAHSYSLQKKKNDFWILVSPDFIQQKNILESIEQTNFYQHADTGTNSGGDQEAGGELKLNYYVAIISLNKDFIKWIELRFGYFENIENLNSKKTLNYKSNGILGSFELISNINPLSCYSKEIYPSILIDKYKKSLELFSLT
jgi:hypothetical protein